MDHHHRGCRQPVRQRQKPPETLRAPTLLLHAPAYGLVRNEQLAAYADRVEAVELPGMHVVMWDAFDEVADAVERFLENSRPER